MSEAELAQVGADRVWSIVCFFVDRSYRGRGFGHKLLRAAIRYAAAHGATMLEAYPADAAQRQVTQAGAFSGTVSMFLKTNFEEVGRAYPARAIMRRAIHSSGGRATPKKRFR
jgi:GNAT superfamily N-acetyltransferase